MLPRRQIALALIIRRAPHHEFPLLCEKQNRTTKTQINENHTVLQISVKRIGTKKKKKRARGSVSNKFRSTRFAKLCNGFDLDFSHHRVKGSKNRTWDCHGESTTAAADVLPRISREWGIGEAYRRRRQYRSFLGRSSGKVTPHVHHFLHAFFLLLLLLHLRIFHSFFVSVHGKNRWKNQNLRSEKRQLETQKRRHKKKIELSARKEEEREWNDDACCSLKWKRKKRWEKKIGLERRRKEVERKRINYKVIAVATSDDDVDFGSRGAIRTALRIAHLKERVCCGTFWKMGGPMTSTRGASVERHVSYWT